MSENGSQKVSGLRQYRFQKNSEEEKASSSSGSYVNVPGRKRIKAMNDSDSDNADSPESKTNNNSSSLTISEKEERLIGLQTIRPNIDCMAAQDALVRNSWDITKSAEYVDKAHEYKKRKIEQQKDRPRSSHERNGSRHHSKSHPKQRSDRRKSNDDSDSDNEKPTENVFDSDEGSDVEANDDRMSKTRKSVLDFMNNSKENDMLAIKGCSQKKIDAIIPLRPFKNWHDLVSKIQQTKSLSADILNAVQQLLMCQSNVVTIMKKCNKIVQRLEAAVASGAGITQQPTWLNPECKLTDYQLVGLNWLAVLHSENTNGILADEMGLGKTIQVIAFLTYLKENGLSKNSNLVVVPSSTLDNWDLEFARWSPKLNVVKYQGRQDERRALRIQWIKSGFKDIDIILATYHVVVSTPEEKKMFRISPLDYVIFDEAHMLKNMTTQRYNYLIRINAERRILLTGTPLQNNLLELMSLLCFVMPSIFAKKSEDIKSLFQKNKTGKSDNDEENNFFEQTQIEQAKRIMKPFLLRRLKKDVLQFLPTKTEEIIKVQLPSLQLERYKELVQSFSNADGVVAATNDVSGITMMMDMRKLANHPLLLRYYYTDDDLRKIAKTLSNDIEYKESNAEFVFQDIAILSDFKIYELTEKYKSLKKFPLPTELIFEAGKIKVLDELLPKLKSEGHRVLLFSQFVKVLDILERYLELRDYGYMRLDGQTDVTTRQDLINDYNLDSDYFIFLLSTRAGGLGINLTAADTVIIYDIDFNPYNDKQAEDRCHRMGQKRPVKIYKLIAEGTIDEGMYMVAQEKLNLEKEVTNDSTQTNDEVAETKCMVKILTMALGMDAKRAEDLIVNSPNKPIKNRREDNGDYVEK